MNYFQFVTWLKSVCDFFKKISPTRMNAPKIFLEQGQENNWFLDISEDFQLVFPKKFLRPLEISKTI